LVDEREARLFVQTEAGALFTLLLTGVKRINVDGFSEGNIILDCDVWTDPEIPADILVALNHGGSRETELSHLRSLVAEGGYMVLCIAPSYGATVAALIKGFSVREGLSFD
jgi:hypothetical protein